MRPARRPGRTAGGSPGRRRGRLARTWALPLALGLAAVTAAGLGTTTGRTLAAWTDDAVLPAVTLAAATVVATTTDPSTPPGQAVEHVGWPSTGGPLQLSVRNDGTVEHDLVLVVGPLAADGLPPTGQRPRACPGSVWRSATAVVDGAPAVPVCRVAGTTVAAGVPVGGTTTLVLTGPRAGTADPLHVVALDSASGRFVDTAVVVAVTQPGDAARTVAPPEETIPVEAPAAPGTVPTPEVAASPRPEQPGSPVRSPAPAPAPSAAAAEPVPPPGAPADPTDLTGPQPLEPAGGSSSDQPGDPVAEPSAAP